MIAFKIIAGLFSLLIGSFVNVLIYRIPREESVVFPRSKCTNCKKIVSWYDNLPVVSYIFLLGKCRNCKSPISIRYPFVELTCGVVGFLLFPSTLDSFLIIEFFFKFIIFFVLVAHFFIDIDHKILPNSLNIALLILILGILFLQEASPLKAIIGGALGFLFPLGITYAFYKLRGQIGLGGGDIKLYGIIGLYVGALGVLNTIFLSCLLGSIFALSLMGMGRMKKDEPIAFGPFIILVFLFQFFLPEYYALLPLVR